MKTDQLSVRAHNALLSVGIEDLERLTEITEADLLAIRNIGRQTHREIKAAMDAIGIEFIVGQGRTTSWAEFV